MLVNFQPIIVFILLCIMSFIHLSHETLESIQVFKTTHSNMDNYLERGTSS